MRDFDDAPGFPVTEPPRLYRDSAAISGGRHKPGKPSHNAKPVAAEYGWLTPLRKSKGDPALWFFRCRCGGEVLRLIGGVRRVEREGGVAKCKASCAWEPPHPYSALCVCESCEAAR
jgi:hypothetical protein